jgi:hypothetical protein
LFVSDSPILVHYLQVELRGLESTKPLRWRLLNSQLFLLCYNYFIDSNALAYYMPKRKLQP